MFKHLFACRGTRLVSKKYFPNSKENELIQQERLKRVSCLLILLDTEKRVWWRAIVLRGKYRSVLSYIIPYFLTLNLLMLQLGISMINKTLQACLDSHLTQDFMLVWVKGVVNTMLALSTVYHYYPPLSVYKR